MNHAKKEKDDISIVSCCWSDCDTECCDDMQLNAHIATHLHSLELHDESYNCYWKGCSFQADDLRELHRHSYYHGYHAYLLVRGKKVCDQNPTLPKCNSPKAEKWAIPVLKHDFFCEWLDCGRSFVSIVEFQDHLLQHACFEYDIQKTPNDTRPKVQCNWKLCRKQMDNRYRLIEHMGTHSNKKIVACNNCGEIFRTNTTLFDHLRRQQGNNTHNFQCAQCFKFFATEKLLRTHFLKHVNCHKCSLCNMTCSSTSSLATHIRYRHLKDKPFKCTECDHRCVRKSDLEKHLHHVHNKDAHHCTQPGCSYAVRTYNLLRRHYLEVHGNSPFIYICHCCNKLFKQSKALSTHLIKKHDYKKPSGHKRFTYRIDENEFFRLETMRIESLEVTKQILSPHPQQGSEETQDSSCYDNASLSNEQDGEVVDDVIHTQLMDEVVISLPKEEES